MTQTEALDLKQIDPTQPVLIAGPTASGKSALALRIAQEQGGVIVNGDAIQVYDDWRVLTARPSLEDEALAPHLLYGHVPGTFAYSTGHWLREVADLMNGPDRLIIVGGTGLYFTALTQGLADIPATPPEIRSKGEQLVAERGLAQMISELDPASADRIDLQNPMRIARAWEVLQATGRGIADWQDSTPPPLLPESDAACFVLDAPKDWLTPRIEKRFRLMIDGGALEEAKANFDAWSPTLPSAKAIGAAELMSHLRGEMDIDTVIERSSILTRQFAKRQRTWFRARMKDWTHLPPDDMS